jgi:hypothetical protein
MRSCVGNNVPNQELRMTRVSIRVRNRPHQSAIELALVENWRVSDLRAIHCVAYGRPMPLRMTAWGHVRKGSAERRPHQERSTTAAPVSCSWRGPCGFRIDGGDRRCNAKSPPLHAAWVSIRVIRNNASRASGLAFYGSASETTTRQSWPGESAPKAPQFAELRAHLCATWWFFWVR